MALHAMTTPAISSLMALRRGQKQLGILVNGRGKPFLLAELDSQRLQRYEVAFDVMESEFTHDQARVPLPD